MGASSGIKPSSSLEALMEKESWAEESAVDTSVLLTSMVCQLSLLRVGTAFMGSVSTWM